MFEKLSGAKITDGISPSLAARLIEYAEGRIKQEGYSVAEGSVMSVLRYGEADSRYEVEWTNLRAGQQVAVVCILAHQERSFMDMGIRKTTQGQRMTHF